MADEVEEMLSCPWRADDACVRVIRGPEPHASDPVIGRFSRAEYVRAVVDQHNEWLLLGRLVEDEADGP